MKFTTPIGKDGTMNRIARGRKPDYDKEEKDMWEDFKGPKPRPLGLAIPATLKYIGKVYMWGCTLGVSMAIIYVCIQWIGG